MNNLTNNQQTILNQLIGEFNRINTMKTSNKGFNLIDINPLEQINREIKEHEELAKADEETWFKMRTNEAQRIIELLKQDLQGYCVQKYGKENQHLELPNILIRKHERASTHHEDSVIIRVGNHYRDSYVHNNLRQFGTELYYTIGNGIKYKTIEEAVSSDHFKWELRRKILN